MAFLIAVALSFGPAFLYATIVYWLDRFEKEPRRLLVGAFLWGAIVATVGAIIATLVLQFSVETITGDAMLAEVTGTTILAPLVEESLKGLAVALILAVFPHEFDSVLDGMVYAAITALGFAATENVLYLYFTGYVEGGYAGMLGLFVLRVILGGWGHAVYTACIGVGLAVARLRPGIAVKLLAPLLGWLAAVLLHALHNTMAVFAVDAMGGAGLLATLLVDWTTWAATFGVLIWALFRERRWMRTYLAEEVRRGVISPEHYRVACSLRAQFGARLRGRQVNRFYELCAELAQKKHQLAMVGEERDNSARIDRLRTSLLELGQGWH